VSATRRLEPQEETYMGLDERAHLGTAAHRLATGAKRFRHGFLQLVHAFQAIHRDPFAWKRYVRVGTIQALVTLAIAGVSVSTARHSSEGLREEQVRKALQRVEAVEPHAAPAVAPPTLPKSPQTPKSPIPPHSSPPAEVKPVVPSVPAKATADDDDDEPDEDEKDTPDTADTADTAHTNTAFQRGLQQLQASIIDLSKKAGATAVRRDSEFQKDRMDLDEKLTELEHSARKVQLTEEDKATLLRLGSELDVLEQKTKPGFWDSALALALSIYGALSVAQAVVIALSRDYHAAIARDASLLLGVAPEDPPLAPRVRLNVAWIRRKFRQRTRSILVFLPGVGLITLAALPFPERARVTSVLISFWAVYWWVVWTASKSARAWEREGVARSPWFLRLWHEHVATLPFVGWMARSLERLWARLTRAAYSPAEAVEAQPAEFAGLAAARALQLIPLLKLFVRPLVPVAAARLLAERTVRSDQLLRSPKERASIAAERAAVPASPGALEARDEM
jgi:hypothetical protein